MWFAQHHCSVCQTNQQQARGVRHVFILVLRSAGHTALERREGQVVAAKFRIRRLLVFGPSDVHAHDGAEQMREGGIIKQKSGDGETLPTQTQRTPRWLWMRRHNRFNVFGLNAMNGAAASEEANSAPLQRAPCPSVNQLGLLKRRSSKSTLQVIPAAIPMRRHHER